MIKKQSSVSLAAVADRGVEQNGNLFASERDGAREWKVLLITFIATRYHINKLHV